MQVIGALLQMHREDKPHKTQVMVAMEVTDEDVVDAMEIHLHLHQLHLCGFAAINQEGAVLNLDQLG